LKLQLDAGKLGDNCATTAYIDKFKWIIKRLICRNLWRGRNKSQSCYVSFGYRHRGIGWGRRGDTAHPQSQVNLL